MTRAGSGGGPVEGRHGAPSTGRHADAGRAPERGRGRHAAPDADGADGRAALERALREPPPGGRRRTRPAPAPAVTERDEPPGRWNGVGPGALVLPARVNGRHSSAEEAAPPAALNGWHAAEPGPPAALNGWHAAEPEPPAANGQHAPADFADRWQFEPPASWHAAETEPEPPALNGWHAGTPGPAADLPAPVDDWQVEAPTGWHATEPEPPAPNGHYSPAPPADLADGWRFEPSVGWHTAEPEPEPPVGWHTAEPEPEPPALNGWHAGTPGPAADLPAPVDDWQVETPTGWHTARPEPEPPTGWHTARPEPEPPTGWPTARPEPEPPTGWPTARPEPEPPTGWPTARPEPPAAHGHRSPAGLADDWQVDRPIPLPAGPERIGDLPRPVDDRPPGRRALRPPAPLQAQPQPPTGVPMEVRRATPPAPAAYRRPPRVDGPLPPPSAGRRPTDPQRPLNGPGPAAHPIGERVVHVFDGDSTQLLRRYVPAQETLDREDRQPAPARPSTQRKHPPRAVVRRRRARRRLLEWPFLIIFALLSAYLIRAYVVQTFYIPSGSMHETLLEGDRVLVNKVSYHLHDVDRGDVVVFRRPPDFPAEDEDLIKRVVALPGETVEARGRQIYVNGKPLTEPYVEPLCQGTQDFAAVTVPAGDLWVMGDNRCNSSDSRVFGPISEDLLVGRAFVLAWPFARLSWL